MSRHERTYIYERSDLQSSSFWGPVGAPDNRRFTPDPNPYDVEPEPRGFGGALQQVIEENPELKDVFTARNRSRSKQIRYDSLY